MIKRGLRGPCWLTLTGPTRKEGSGMVGGMWGYCIWSGEGMILFTVACGQRQDRSLEQHCDGCDKHQHTCSISTSAADMLLLYGVLSWGGQAV
jgi:hypothetical protein